MSPKNRFRRWLWLLIANPITMSAAMVVVGAEFHENGRAAIARWRWDGLFQTPLTLATMGRGWEEPTVYVLRDGDSFRVLRPDSQSWDETATALSQYPERMLALTATWREAGRGVWAITAVDEVRAVRIGVASGSTFDAADRARARATAFAGSDLEKTDIERHHVRWRGYLSDVLTAAGIIVLPFSCLWIPAVPGLARAARRERALSRGRCPECGYSLAGLDAAVCPECGTGVSSAPSGAGSQ